MSLADCLKKLKVPDATAKDIQAMGLDAYSAELSVDLESLRSQLTEQGFDVPAIEPEPLPSTRELFQSFNQGAIEDSAEFKAWAGSDQVEIIEPDEINDFDFKGDGPFVVRAFHGTTHDFDVFRGEDGTKESQFGALNYFTSSEYDAEVNYAGDGPDLTNRIQRRAEEIASNEGLEYDDPDVLSRAKEELRGQSDQVIEVFIRTEKPFVVGENSDWIEFFNSDDDAVFERVAENEGVSLDEINDNPEQYEDAIDEARWEIQEENGNPVVDAVENVASRYGVDTADLIGKLYDYGDSISQQDLESLMRESESFAYADDPETGDLIGYQLLAEVIEELGFDSIILKDAEQRFSSMDMPRGTTHIHVFESGKSNIKGVENQGTFDRNDERFLFQENRASIQFTPGGTRINLGLGADRSSFLHESGHLFLEQLRQDQQDFGVNAPELVDDWNTVKAWWGKNAEAIKQEAIDIASRANDSDAVAEIAAMSANKVKEFVVTGDLNRSKDAQGYISVAMHEQWARGVEDYFRTGNAPSIALQDAFNRFRAWLVSIYKNVTGKGSLDVRFSDDVRQVMDRLLATDAEIDLMATQYDMKAMFGSAEEIGMTPSQFKNYQREVARSVEEAKSRQLKKHLNEIERERRDWWIAEREAVKAEIEKEVHDRREYKLMYALTEGTMPDGTPMDVRRNRMDRKAINAILENDESAKRLPRVRGKTLYATSSKEGNSHPDVIAMAYGYQNARDMLIELMNVQPMNTVINEQADAVMKERHGDMTLPEEAEAAAIESVHGDKRGDVLLAEVNALRKGQTKMKSAFVRQWAKEQMGKQKVDNIKPTKFLAAEKRYAKQAAKEFKAGNMLEAQRAKFRQMMNHFMAQESYRVRTEMEKSRNYMRKFNQKQKLFKSIDADYVDRIKEILGSYQLGPRLSDKKRRQISAQAFTEWMEAQAENEGAIFNIPQEILDADEKTHYRDLTLDEFRTLTDSIKNLEAQGRMKKKAIIAGELVDIEQMESDILNRLNNIPTKKVEAAKAIRQDPSFGDRATERFHSFDASLRKVEFLMEFMDGEVNGPAHQAFFQPVADAEAMKNDIVRNINQTFMDKLAELPKEVRKGLGRNQFVPSLNREMNRGNLIMLALNIGNDSNLDKTIRGSEQEGAGWTEEGIMEALDVLTKEEWDFVQTVWDSFEEIYPQVQEIYRRENGVSPEKIEPKTIETKYGEYTGRYFPMIYDPRRSAMSRDLEGKSALEAMQSQTVKAGVFSGMTKARTNFAAPVMLDITAMPQQIRRMAHYVSHYETVRLTRKLLSRKALSSAITEKLGENYYRELKGWIGDIAADGQTDKHLHFWDRAVEAMRTNVTIAIMGLSYTTGASQLLGWAQSIDGLARRPDGSYNPGKASMDMLWGVKEMLTQKGITDWVMETSGEMRHRVDNVDRDLAHAMKQLSGKKNAWQKMQRATLIHIAYLQVYMVDVPTWIAARDNALKDGKSDTEAINYADSVVRRTQTAGGTKDLSQIQRQRGLMNAFTMFYSFFNLLYNIQARAIGDTNFKKPKDIGKFAARAAVVLVLPTALEAMMRGEGPDDEESYARWLAIKSSLYSASSIAFIRDLTGIAEGYGYSATPLDSIPAEMTKAVKEIAKAYDEGEMTREVAEKSLAAAGFAFGFPVLQPKRFFDAMEKWEEDGTMPDVVEFLRGPDEE